MNRAWLKIFIGMNIILSLGILTLTDNWTTAQSENTTSSNTNGTRMIYNVKDNTITIVNNTSNETISISTLTANTGNMITNESLSTDNVTENAENTTTNLNLTEKFKELQNQ
jgi:hypothetical protein